MSAAGPQTSPPAQPSFQSICPRCQKPLSFRLACAACGALFADPKVDAFAQLGLPPTFELDAGQLNDRYLAVSRLAHPDRHVNGGEAAQELAESVMALANQAKATLSDPRRRAETLIVRLCGDGGVQPPVKQPPSGAFLMEIMDWTERVAGAKDGEKPGLIDNIRAQIGALQGDLAQAMGALATAVGAKNGTAVTAAAQQARDLLDRLSYWHRLLENATGTGEHKLIS